MPLEVVAAAAAAPALPAAQAVNASLTTQTICRAVLAAGPATKHLQAPSLALHASTQCTCSMGFATSLARKKGTRQQEPGRLMAGGASRSSLARLNLLAVSLLNICTNLRGATVQCLCAIVMLANTAVGTTHAQTAVLLQAAQRQQQRQRPPPPPSPSPPQ